MLEGILRSLRDVKYGFYSTSLVEDFEPIIPETSVRLIYSIKEANNIYTVVFYVPEAIVKNDSFEADRDDCFINDRPDYLDTLEQSKSSYVVIYRNNKPVASAWFVADEEYTNAVIFNAYGSIRNLGKFFGTKKELMKGDREKLEQVLKVQVNDDIILTTTDDYNKFIYKLFCPNCHAYIESTDLVSIYDEYEDDYRLRCPQCSGLVSDDISVA